MLVKIDIYYYNNKDFFKDLIDELKKKKSVINKENVFNIDLELKVNSFDEIICVLEKYSKEIDISLYINNINNVTIFISKSEHMSFGDQVE